MIVEIALIDTVILGSSCNGVVNPPVLNTWLDSATEGTPTKYLDFSTNVDHVTMEFSHDSTATLAGIDILINDQAAMEYLPGPPETKTFHLPLTQDVDDFSYDEATKTGTLTITDPAMRHEGTYKIVVKTADAKAEDSVELPVNAIKYCESTALPIVQPDPTLCKVVVTGAGCPGSFIYHDPEAGAEVKLSDSSNEVVGTPLVLAKLAEAPPVGEEKTFKFGLIENGTANAFIVDGNTPKNLKWVYTYVHGDAEGHQHIGDEDLIATWNNEEGCPDWSTYCQKPENERAYPKLAGVAGLDHNLECVMENFEAKPSTCRPEQVGPVKDQDLPAKLTFSCKACKLSWTETLPGAEQPTSKSMECGTTDTAWMDVDPALKGKWPYCYCEPESGNGASNLSVSIGFSALLVLVAKILV